MENYVGEIRLFAGTFAPEGWAYCQGQLLAIEDNETLFQLLGTTYGGDGTSTFALPNLQSRVVVGQGSAPGLMPYALGTTAGTEAVVLTTNELAPHQHPFMGSGQVLTGGTPQNAPGGAYLGDQGGSSYDPTATGSALGPGAVTGQMTPAGGGQPHPNIQPVLAVSYIIALAGAYPTPS